MNIKNAELGAQDCYLESSGSFTGEISPLMLGNVGCRYVIVGHSERRRVFNELPGIIKDKLKAVLDAGLSPILCVGENSKKDDAERVLEEQLGDIVEYLEDNVIIAYEPVFAIGTGEACSPGLAKKRREHIKEFIRSKRSNIVPSFLYGGSVGPENAACYIEEAGFDGLLVGGASLESDKFNIILQKLGW